MDDLLELTIRLLDPIASYLGPHALAFVAIAGALTTYVNAKKQRRREKRFESKLDFIIRGMGLQWNAESAASSAYTGQRSSPLSRVGIFLVRYATRFTRQLVTVKYELLRRTQTMQNINWVSLTVALLGMVKMVLQANGVDVITDEQINDIANSVAAIAAIIGVIASHRKKGAIIGGRVNYAKADDVDA